MKVFISWSGTSSKHVATSLHEWLPLVIQSLQPWMSDVDIDAGSRWFDSITMQLNDPNTSTGVICMTADNLDKPWLHFEAGALAKALGDRSLVCPYLLNISPSELKPPLSMFNAVESDKDGTRKLLTTLNKSLPSPLLKSVLDQTFEAMWPKLDQLLRNTPAPKLDAPARTERSMLQEMLSILRGQELLSLSLTGDESTPAVCDDEGGELVSWKVAAILDSERVIVERVRSDGVKVRKVMRGRDLYSSEEAYEAAKTKNTNT